MGSAHLWPLFSRSLKSCLRGSSLHQQERRQAVQVSQGVQRTGCAAHGRPCACDARDVWRMAALVLAMHGMCSAWPPLCLQCTGCVVHGRPCACNARDVWCMAALLLAMHGMCGAWPPLCLQCTGCVVHGRPCACDARDVWCMAALVLAMHGMCGAWPPLCLRDLAAPDQAVKLVM